MPFSHKPTTHREFTYGLIVIMIVSFSLAALGLVVANANQRETERKFCAIMAESHNRAVRAVEAYRENPPSTDAGRAQREETEKSLALVIQLERDLGCPPSEGAGE